MNLWVALALIFSTFQPQTCCTWTVPFSCMGRPSSIALSTTSNNEEHNKAEAAEECESQGTSRSLSAWLSDYRHTEGPHVLYASLWFRLCMTVTLFQVQSVIHARQFCHRISAVNKFSCQPVCHPILSILYLLMLYMAASKRCW